jgi:glucan phosphoethanolaminetransferase (alkaline phosphatase superfamily)
MLDLFYISVFNYYKKKLGKRSYKLALFYIDILEASMVFALGTFFLAFASQMKIATMSFTKFLVLFGLISVFIIFKNWMRYNGKKRNILRAKLKSSHSIYLLWILPLACLSIGLILLQAL